MADGLLTSILGAIDQQKQATKAGLGLLVSNPMEFARSATARYFPTPEEVAQQRAMEQAGTDTFDSPYMQKLFNLAQFQGSIKPTGLLQSVKPKINMQTDRMNRFIFQENKNPNIILTTSADQFDPKYMNAYLEVIGDPKKVGGKGTATRLYLEGLDIAKKNNMGWKSDTVTSGATQKMYERLTNMGIPFQKVDNQFILSPEQLSKINLPKK